jgi:hypothetical protein
VEQSIPGETMRQHYICTNHQGLRVRRDFRLRVRRAAFPILFAASAFVCHQAIADENPDLQLFAADHYAQVHRVETAEALRRLAIQDQAAGLDDELSNLLGSQYAGIWFDAEDGGRVKVGIAPGAAAQAASVQRIVYSYGLTAMTDLVSVRYTEGELQDMQESARRSLDEMIDSGHASTAYNTKSNAVVITAPVRLPSSEETRIQSLARNAWVRVRRVNAPALVGQYDTCNITFCNPPMRGGRGISIGKSGNCTAGFVAQSRTVFDDWWMLTAGHCVFFGGTTWNAQNESGVWSQLGNSAFFSFAGGPGYDAGIIHLNWNSVWMTPPPIAALIVKASANTTYDPTYAIHTTAFSSVGQMICRTGQTTGTECGEVTDLGADFTAGGFTTHNLGEVDVCGSQGGDSGGPMYKIHRAYGLHNGTMSFGPAFCHEYYQGVRGAENIMGVAVFTAP